MRLLMVSNMWPRAGRPAFGSFVRSQVESVRCLGVEVEVSVIPGEQSAAAYLTHIPVIRRAVRHLRPDLVHAHYGLSGWTSSWQPAPLVVSFCGDDLLGTIGPSGRPSLKSRLAVRMSRAVARRAQGIICKSANLVAGLPRAADRERAHIIPNGVDLRRFAPGDRAAARERLGLPPDIPIVLFPHDARARLQKRFALAEAAMELVTAELPGAQLLMPNGVPHGEMPDYYRASDALLLTSHSEGSPNVVKEAIACAVPVVSVDVGDVRWWVEQVEGCRITNDDPPSLASALIEVLRTRPEIDPAPVLTALDQAATARRLVDVYESVLGGAA